MQTYQFESDRQMQMAMCREIGAINWPLGRQIIMGLALLGAIWLPIFLLILTGMQGGSVLAESLDNPLYELVGTIVGLLLGVGYHFGLSSKLSSWIMGKLAVFPSEVPELIRVEIDANQICWTTPNLQVSARWSGVKSVKATETGVMIVLGLNGIYVPKAAFANEADIEALIATCEEYRKAAA